MNKLIPLALLCASLGAPSLSFAAGSRKVAGVEKTKVKKKKAGAAKRVKKVAPAAIDRLPNS